MPGRELKKIRESQGVDLETISKVTRIPLHHLKALEADHKEQLPAPVFVKGFIRSYAHALGVESAGLLALVPAAPEPSLGLGWEVEGGNRVVIGHRRDLSSGMTFSWPRVPSRLVWPLVILVVVLLVSAMVLRRNHEARSQAAPSHSMPFGTTGAIEAPEGFSPSRSTGWL